MPISGLTDRGRLPRIGKIRLGEKVATKSGGERPSATDHFVVKEDDSTPAWAVEAFQSAYGTEPKELVIMFPPGDDLLFADANYKYWTQSQGMICIGDGHEARARWDDKAKGERPPGIDSGSWKMPSSDMANVRTLEIPCLAEACPMQKVGNCGPEMVLQFFLVNPDGVEGDVTAGLWQLTTGSKESIVSVRGAIDLVKNLTGGRLYPVQFRMRLAGRKVVVDGNAKTVYSLHLAPKDALMEIMRKVRAIGDNPLALLPPADEPEAEFDDAIEGEVIEPADAIPSVQEQEVEPEPEEEEFERKPMMTESQKHYLFGGGNIPKDQSLTSKWIAKMGGQQAVIEHLEGLPDAIKLSIKFAKDGKSLAWDIALTSEDAGELISVLRKELNIKDKAEQTQLV